MNEEVNTNDKFKNLKGKTFDKVTIEERIPSSHPWGNFLNARLDAMLYMRDERGYSEAEITQALTVDERQIRSILSFNDKYRNEKR